jgi:two-component system, OmpR family, heavy metal sensor histidine kinase CusS
MSSKYAEAEAFRARRRWAMTTSLTIHYTISVFVLMSAAAVFLYWELSRAILEQQQDYLHHKLQVLELLLHQKPLNLAGLEQETREEAGISGQSRSPFLLRVLDPGSRIVAETPDMGSTLPATVFPTPEPQRRTERSWRSPNGADYLLASAAVTEGPPSAGAWRVQAALSTSLDEELLAHYRRDIVLVLLLGLVIAATMGAYITRRGLRPLANITHATERIGIQQLQERIEAGPWPKELASLAAAFDSMLDRLQESFERLSQFSADLAHELRSPINNLIGETQVALSRERTAAEYARVLQSALEEHGRLARMIDSMLFLAQAEQARVATARVVLDARAELNAVAEFYQPLAEEQGVQLVCEGRAAVAADPLLLRRAISNLLSNALKYTPRGGRITLLATELPSDGPTISVTDTGVGIPPEHVSRVGDRFYRVDTSRTDSAAGFGLGLAIVKSIMAIHGGRLLIDSTVGRGTIASLVFPAPVPPATT